eukprot:TRINITY_DN38023_c0_g1_i1.p1 TRINITY_DN38023_c0_g1~~TRINITY_DN38023_c0_g1_i1.p1  ORF type:complete len:180 (+),score=27.77 TRINITY_DN38023_c0_g1_i1:121-660(+)
MSDEPVQNLLAVSGKLWNVNSAEGDFSEMELCLDRIARADRPQRRSLSPQESIQQFRRRPLYEGSAISGLKSRSLCQLRGCKLTPLQGLATSWADDGAQGRLYGSTFSLEGPRPSTHHNASIQKSDHILGKKSLKQRRPKSASRITGTVDVAEVRSRPALTSTTGSFYTLLRHPFRNSS